MPLEPTLAALEKQLEEVSAALLAGDPLALERASGGLRQAVIDFSGMMERSRNQPLPAGMAVRLQKASAQLAMQRDNLARVTALVDRQVASVLPPADAASTYGKAVGVRSGPGGAAARFYRNAG
jgi:hypothetical protein